MTLFSEAEQQRIADAISSSEAHTSGEIVAVVAHTSDDYFYIPLLWAAIVALLVPWILIFQTWLPAWQIYAIQLATFLVVALLARFDAIRLALVPKGVKHARGHRNAVEQFLAQGMHTTKGRTGVLIFVSVAERFAEVIADDRIYELVPKSTWQNIVDSLIGQISAGKPVEGFVSAIEASGQLLAQHFPPGSEDPDELPNHLIVLD